MPERLGPFHGKTLVAVLEPLPLARRVEFLEEALEEAEQATRWYAERSPAAAAAFSDELEKAGAAILAGPLTWPRALHGTRRYLLWRFPFSVIFRIEPGRIVIIAIAHSSRKPGYWAKRSPRDDEDE